MTYSLSDHQFDAVVRLSDDERFDYFLQKVIRWETIWSLSSPEGWVELSSPDGDELLPLWPHRDFAQAWAVDDWSDCQPEAIELGAWLERWTTGLSRDQTLLTIFPVGDEGLVLTPADFEQSLLALLEVA